jgi:hypothetical protein
LPLALAGPRWRGDADAGGRAAHEIVPIAAILVFARLSFNRASAASAAVAPHPRLPETARGDESAAGERITPAEALVRRA